VSGDADTRRHGFNLEGALDLARQARLYPSLILHGGTAEARLAAAETLARALLCVAEPAERPCGVCRQCRRIAVADAESELFHPDVGVLRRDLKTSTSVDATRELLRITHQAPFEARGQVLVIAEAESLTEEAGNALLKQLEEPPSSAPRNFFLLARAREELLPTLRSRSWAVWLGPAASLPASEVDGVAEELTTALVAFQARPTPIYLLAAAGALSAAGGWEDVRAERPWALAAAAVLSCVRRVEAPPARRALLALAEDLLDGSTYRLRSIPAQRILDGLVFRRLAPLVSRPGAG
jgi:DNA polymerase III, delta subunit